MKISMRTLIGTLLGALLAMLLSTSASAIQMDTRVAQPYQVGTTAIVKVGHTVIASTNYNRLAAGGSFVLTCAMPENLPITGERSLSNESFIGGAKLIVTIPYVVPTSYSVPGFASLNRGDVVVCTYAWKAQAAEGGYKIGPRGIDFTTGNGTASFGSTEIFQMKAPDKASEDDGTTCIP